MCPHTHKLSASIVSTHFIPLFTHTHTRFKSASLPLPNNTGCISQGSPITTHYSLAILPFPPAFTYSHHYSPLHSSEYTHKLSLSLILILPIFKLYLKNPQGLSLTSPKLHAIKFYIQKSLVLTTILR